MGMTASVENTFDELMGINKEGAAAVDHTDDN